MQDSPEHGKQSIPEGLNGLDLGHRVYARHLDFPSVSPLGPGIASRLAWFGADRLPLAQHILQRWSVGEWHGLPNLQWLSGFASSRRNTTTASSLQPAVARTRSEARVDLSSVGEAPQPSASELASSATDVPSRSGLGNAASPPARMTSPSRIERTVTQVLRSADERTMSENATGSASLSRSTNQALPTNGITDRVSRSSEGSESGPPSSATKARSHNSLAGTASTLPSAATSRITTRPSVESARTPVLRSGQKKSGNESRVRSTILESIHHDLSRTSVSRMSEAHGQGPTASTSKAQPEVRSMISESVHRDLSKASISSKSETHGQGVTPLSLEATRHDIHSRIERTSGEPPANSELPKEAKENEEKEKGSIHVASPAPKHGELTAKPDNDPAVTAENHGSILRAAETGHPGITYVGPPIYRRSVGGSARAATPASLSRSAERLRSSSEASRHVEGSLPLPPDAIHSVGRSGSAVTGHHGGGQQLAARPAMGEQVATKSAGELTEPQNSNNNNKDVERSSTIGSWAAASELQHTVKEADRFHQPESKLGSDAANPQQISEVHPARTAVGRTTTSSARSGESSTFVQRIPSTIRLPEIQTNRSEETAEPVSQMPSRIHAKLSPSPDSPAAASSRQSSEVRTQNLPAVGTVAGESTVARTPDQSVAASSSEARSALLATHRPSLTNGANTSAPISRGIEPRLVQRFPGSTTTRHIEQPPNSATTEMGSGTLSRVSAVSPSANVDRRTELPSTDSQNITYLFPQSARVEAPPTQMMRSADGGVTIDQSIAIPTVQAETMTSPAEGSSSSIATRVHRSIENNLLRIDTGSDLLKADGGASQTVPEAGTKAEQPVSTVLRSATSVVPRVSLSQRSNLPILRQSALPVASTRLSAASTTLGIHRFAGMFTPEPVHRSSSYALDAAKGAFRSSNFTHRTVQAIDQLQRSTAPNLAASFLHNINSSSALIARNTGGAVGAVAPATPAPSLPSVTSQSSRPPQGLKNAELKQLANRVYELLVRRIASERQRKGN